MTVDNGNKRCLSAVWLYLIGCIGSLSFNAIQFPAALLLGATFTVTGAGFIPHICFRTPQQKYYDWAQIYTDKIAPPHLKSQAQGLIFFVTFAMGLLLGNLFQDGLLTSFRNKLHSEFNTDGMLFGV